MINKNKKDDFFIQMQNFQLDRFNRLSLFITITLITFAVLFSILCVIFSMNASAINQGTIGLLWASVVGVGISCISEFIFFVLMNTMEFKAGKLSGGLVNFAISVIIVYSIIFIVNANLPKEQQYLIPAIIAAVTAFFTAVLALMGIHYSTMKKREERMINNKLIFIKDAVADETIEYALHRDIDCMVIDVCIRNISNNLGFLSGLYRICGCDIYVIEESLPYFPIAPHTSYILKNVSFKNGDDHLLLTYKDIDANYYYIHLRIISNHAFEIINIDICDMSFIRHRLNTTKSMAHKLTNNNLSTDEKIESDHDENCSINKENTKPLRTRDINGYEIIVDKNGEDLTNIVLLEKLKKERLIISRANRIRAYMIFNNQQLVALATYKPINRNSFISIYGLGEGKYNLYGKDFIDIIKKHIGT